MFQVQGWVNVPNGVLAKVFSELPVADCWKSRQVSRTWALQVRQTLSFDVEIIANTSNLVCKVQALFRRQLQERLPCAVVTFRITRPLHLEDLVQLLQALRNQRKHLSSFRLKIGLLIPNTSEVSKATSHAKQVEFIASGLLTNYGVKLSITVHSAKGATRPPPPAVLQSLAPFLNSIDIYSVPREQTLCKGQLHTLLAAHSAFTPAHIAALRHYSSNLSVLCISECDLSRRVPLAVPLADSMADIAQLTGLTKLHLTLDHFTQLVDFQPLSQLSSLKDLALYCRSGTASCAGVLQSSRDTLCHVSLASLSWTLDTYHALQQMHSLDTLILKLWVLSAPQADALAGITAGFVHLDLHQIRLLPDQPLLNLTAVNLAVHELTLWNLDDASCQQLGSLQSLQTLTVVNSPSLTGTTFNIQPNLTDLTFMNCSGVSPRGVQHILDNAMPACKKLALQCWGGRGTANPLMAHAGADVLSGGRNLVIVDLCGVRGLNKGFVERLRAGIEREQEIGNAEPVVMLHVPCCMFLEQCQSSGRALECLHTAPFLAHTGFWNEPKKVECNHRKQIQRFLVDIAQSEAEQFVAKAVMDKLLPGHRA